MSDVDVLMALDICTTGSVCDGCPYREKKDEGTCLGHACMVAVEVIKKQKEEIESLAKENAELRAEIERSIKIDTLKERVKGILLDEHTLAEIIDEVKEVKI